VFRFSQFRFSHINPQSLWFCPKQPPSICRINLSRRKRTCLGKARRRQTKAEPGWHGGDSAPGRCESQSNVKSLRPHVAGRVKRLSVKRAVAKTCNLLPEVRE
jgi:hypothetical protein